MTPGAKGGEIALAQPVRHSARDAELVRLDLPQLGDKRIDGAPVATPGPFFRPSINRVCPVSACAGILRKSRALRKRAPSAAAASVNRCVLPEPGSPKRTRFGAPAKSEDGRGLASSALSGAAFI